jgi:hypothetical protein
MSNESFETRLSKIEERNQKVELEKAWETSWARFWCNTGATYLVMNLVLWTIDGPFPALHALVPTCGYVLSTLSLPVLKRMWIARQSSQNSGI